MIRSSLLAIVLAGLLSGCGGGDTPPPAPPKASEPGVITIAAGSPQLDSIAVVTAERSPLPISADLNARLAVDEGATARVGAPVAGRVTAILADIDTPVRAGQPLARIDAPDLAQARADAARAAADADLKARAATRAAVLYRGEAIAQRDLEAARSDDAMARAELARSQARLRNLGSGIGNGGTSLALASPVSGYVLDRKIEPGDQVSAGQTPLFTVTDPKRLWLVIDVPEDAVSRARVGEDVEFDVGAWTGRHFRARIQRIGLGVDPETRRVQVRAAVANPDLALKPEMYARARLVTDDGRTALKVPNAALFEQGLKSYVFRVEAQGRFRRIPVVVGARGSDVSYVTDGLKPGDRIVGEGALLLNAQLSGE